MIPLWVWLVGLSRYKPLGFDMFWYENGPFPTGTWPTKAPQVHFVPGPRGGCSTANRSHSSTWDGRITWDPWNPWKPLRVTFVTLNMGLFYIIIYIYLPYNILVLYIYIYGCLNWRTVEYSEDLEEAMTTHQILRFLSPFQSASASIWKDLMIQARPRW